jgi:hypothetical protein
MGYPSKGIHGTVSELTAIVNLRRVGPNGSGLWYVASPNISVPEARRLEKIGAAVEELRDKVG